MPISLERIGDIPSGVGRPSRTPTLTANANLAALAPYLADASANTAPVPNVAGITVLGRVSTLSEYDRDSRPTFSVAPNLAVDRTDYDGAGRVLQTTDSALNNGFNASQGKFIPANLAGSTGQTAYDGDGNAIETKQTDVTTVPGVGPEVFYAAAFYDALNRPQTQVDSLGQTQDFRYDSRGNLVAEADANGPLSPTRTLPGPGLGAGSLNVNNYGNVIVNSYDGQNRQLESENRCQLIGPPSEGGPMS
jgi:YD repeat-containing protein